jgi:hypothetical protein
MINLSNLIPEERQDEVQSLAQLGAACKTLIMGSNPIVASQI